MFINRVITLLAALKPALVQALRHCRWPDRQRRKKSVGDGQHQLRAQVDPR